MRKLTNGKRPNAHYSVMDERGRLQHVRSVRVVRGLADPSLLVCTQRNQSKCVLYDSYIIIINDNNNNNNNKLKVYKKRAIKNLFRFLFD